MKRHEYRVYILANKANTVFYIGVTSDLEGRISEHKLKIYKGFTSKYKCDKLVYYEEFQVGTRCNCKGKTIKSGLKTEENRLDNCRQSLMERFK